MENPIKKNEGQIQVNLPKEKRIEAIKDIASANEQIAIALRSAAESNIQLAKALQVSPQIMITGCSIISNGQFDTGISIKGESDFDEHKEAVEDSESCYCNDCEETEEENEAENEGENE